MKTTSRSLLRFKSQSSF